MKWLTVHIILHPIHALLLLSYIDNIYIINIANKYIYQYIIISQYKNKIKIYKNKDKNKDKIMAAKLKDGLFIGDADTSFSEEFINDNKISNLVNLSGREVPNNWAAHGLVYLTFYW
jgi:hypothetical protein